MALRLSTRRKLGKALEAISQIVEKCGGPGSGIPGPCPIAGKLEHFKASKMARKMSERAQAASKITLQPGSGFSRDLDSRSAMALKSAHSAESASYVNNEKNAKSKHMEAEGHHMKAVELHESAGSSSWHKLAMKAHKEAAEHHRAAAKLY